MDRGLGSIAIIFKITLQNLTTDFNMLVEDNAYSSVIIHDLLELLPKVELSKLFSKMLIPKVSWKANGPNYGGKASLL